MKKLILTGLLILISSLDGPAQKGAEQLKICITEQEHEIYKLVGVGNFQNATHTYPLKEYVEAQLREVSRETVADFKEKNGRAYLLRCVDKPGGKPAKLRKSTGGNASASFSRIGFGHDGTEALVYNYWQAVGNYCGGEFVLLRKSAGKWEVVQRVSTVIC